MNQAPIVIIFDSSYKQYLNNRIFLDPSIYAEAPGASWLRILYEESISNGWNIMTSDIYLKEPTSGTAFLISEAITPYTDTLLGKGVVPLIIFSGESPNVDLGFFFRIKKNTEIFKHSILFSGLKRFVSNHTTFHDFKWPNDIGKNLKYFNKDDWHKRKFMVMISSNKQRFDVPKDKGFVIMRQNIRQLMWIVLRVLSPLFRFKDLYSVRFKAIAFFSTKDRLDLYGKGWGDLKGVATQYKNAIKKLNPQVIDNKQLTLTDYKFSLCFENCIFPGYITEKIFDCFFSGTIPIYYGAPDIAEFIPSDCFIDYRSFKNFEGLDNFLSNIKEEQIEKYLNAISYFLLNERFKEFNDRKFAESIINIIAKS